MNQAGTRRLPSFLERLDDSAPGREAGGENVGPAIVVVVEEKAHKTVVRRLEDRDLLRDVGEMPVAVVVVEPVWRFIAAVDENVEPAVFVVVPERDPDGAIGGRLVEPGCPGDVCERAVAIVPIDLGHAAVLEHAVRDHDIQPAVVVQVAPQRHKAGARVV